MFFVDGRVIIVEDGYYYVVEFVGKVRYVDILVVVYFKYGSVKFFYFIRVSFYVIFSQCNRLYDFLYRGFNVYVVYVCFEVVEIENFCECFFGSCFF